MAIDKKSEEGLCVCMNMRQWDEDKIVCKISPTTEYFASLYSLSYLFLHLNVNDLFVPEIEKRIGQQ